ncbi:uncharacterized protein LOC134244798 isoform X1 [Saccostrea cucullata]|uniref:uncharacterized protein LOC134244798 isoform X1 n=1 Tax=Saccostrea cuccullata TaxID=36930 RepID=UPI002ED4B76D
MTMSEAMLSENSIISPIEQQGNFFIMDSEQLVSNPFQEMQNDAMDSQKKSSLTERLVSVKNNVCEKHFLIKAEKLNKELSHNMKKIHENSSELRYQIKLYDINKRKIDLETKRRMQPKKDFSYDAFQINNSEKRLGVLSDCYYLEKKQKFPIRGRNMNDLNATPTVSRARNMLRQQEKEDREEENSTISALRLSTPGTLSLTSNRTSIFQRRGSKSAPASKMSASVRGTLNSQDGESAKLPSIDRQKTKDSHVKFTEHVQTSTPEKRVRPHTHGPRITRRLNAWDSDDDDDDFGSTDYINLRQLLFGAEGKTNSNGSSGTPRTLTRESSRSVPNLRRTTGSKVTQESLRAERRQIDKKINKFFESLNDEISSEESEEEPEPEPEKEKKVPALAKAAVLLNIFSKAAPVEENPFLKAKIEREVSKDTGKAELDRSTSSRSTRSNKSATKDENTTKKNLWKFIKTNVNNGKIHRCNSPSQIILQQMTHLDLTHNEVSRVPLHSASRALRHTPTFKMRKVVEKLMKSRTKFQQQEVDFLRQQLEMGENISEIQTQPNPGVPGFQSIVT